MPATVCKEIPSNEQGNSTVTGSSSSITFTERARVIVSGKDSNESRFGFDKSFTSAGGLTVSNDQQEETKKKPANWLDVLQIDPKVYWPKKYRYTAEPRPGSYYMLTIKERDFYEDNGFLIVKNLIPVNAINKIISNLKDGLKLSSTDQPINSAITNETLKTLINSPRIVRYAGSFCGYNIMAMTCSPVYDYFYSDVQSNGFHRDLHCLPFRPADRIVSVWIALENCSIEVTNSNANESSTNSTIDYMVIPGSHRTGYLETIYSDDIGNKVRMFYERIPDVERIRDGPSNKGVRKIQLKTGDAIFYHPLLAYTIKINSQQSPGRLIAVSCRYASSDCDYIETATGSTYQDEIPPYLVNSVADYNLNKDFWRNQGLLIKGKRSNL